MTLPFWFAPRDPQYQWVFYLISDTDSQSCILAWPIRLRVSMFVDQAQGQLCFSHVKDVTTILQFGSSLRMIYRWLWLWHLAVVMTTTIRKEWSISEP